MVIKKVFLLQQSRMSLLGGSRGFVSALLAADKFIFYDKTSAPGPLSLPRARWSLAALVHFGGWSPTGMSPTCHSPQPFAISLLQLNSKTCVLCVLCVCLCLSLSSFVKLLPPKRNTLCRAFLFCFLFFFLPLHFACQAN